MAWLITHAGHHAWQVNRLYEAAMYGSLLDGGGLRGKLDTCGVVNLMEFEEDFSVSRGSVCISRYTTYVGVHFLGD